MGDFQVIFGDGPLPMAIFELLEYIVNEVNTSARLCNANTVMILHVLPPFIVLSDQYLGNHMIIKGILHTSIMLNKFTEVTAQDFYFFMN